MSQGQSRVCLRESDGVNEHKREWNHETVTHKEIVLGLQRECQKDAKKKLRGDKQSGRQFVMERLQGVEPGQWQPCPAVFGVCITPVKAQRECGRACRAVYEDEVYLVTALVPSDTACLASSPGRARRTAVWISRDVRVPFLL